MSLPCTRITYIRGGFWRAQVRRLSSGGIAGRRAEIFISLIRMKGTSSVAFSPPELFSDSTARCEIQEFRSKNRSLKTKGFFAA